MKTGLTRPANLTEQQAVTQANVVRYIRAREGYDPYAIEENFGIAALLSTGDAARELQDLYSAANPQNPARRLWPPQARHGRNQVGDLPERQHRDRALCDHRKSDTESIVRHWISVVRFRYTDTPATNEWRFENPLGFQVYDYRRDQETVTPGDR